MARGITILLGGFIVVVVLWKLLITILHFQEPVYNLPVIALVVVVIATIAALAAAVALVFIPYPRAGLAAALGTLVVGIAALIFPLVGLVLCSVGVIALWGRMARLPHSAMARVAASFLTGSVLAVGFGVVLLVSAQPPMVTCFANGGAGASERAWWGGSSAGSVVASGSANPDGRSSGTITADGRTYTYQCNGSTLTKFTQR